jgi:hypothetical protein
MSLIETVLGSLSGLGLVTNFVIAAEGELDADFPYSPDWQGMHIDGKQVFCSLAQQVLYRADILRCA